ncbi:FAD-dependent oxidoreductase [Pseudoalteromonas sp. PS5]|uniref:FAD-dependent oxidoreductase n=1 Tax=Pseudoalteromonas sp. PS5 TaxID=1437473 RepID=UPI000FFE5619|nr:FAD-dependent oxidoreductase [Pseudoalteromonas sp. PS5]RXF04147.1 potassium transporter [Pseudoalteromonas sp. PS5]
MIVDNIENVDLCIVGAGLAGLNALYAAKQYLPKNATVALVDKRESIGGMWNDTYDYVRLHQPYKQFTIGNMKWGLDRHESYLADRHEILAHFKRCVSEVEQHLTVIPLMQHSYLSHDSQDDGIVQVRLASKETTRQIHTKKLIKSVGFGIEPSQVLAFSSDKVHSITPEQIPQNQQHIKDSNKPIYIVGGGKTAMDTAHYLIQANPQLAIHLIIGKGTYFLNRDIMFPPGLDKYWKGTTSLDMMTQCATLFNGDNEAEVTQFVKSKYALSPHKDAQQFLLGLLSQSELDIVTQGCKTIVRDYLDDIKDNGDETQLCFRSGETQPIESGAWIINCTGYLLNSDVQSEQYHSQCGNVISINNSDNPLLFSSGYFLPHVFFQDKIKDTPLLSIDHVALKKANAEAFPFVAMTQLLYNFYTLMDKLPLKVIDQFHANFDKWYPLHRQLFGFTKFMINKKKNKKHFESSLLRVKEKYNL